MTIDRSKTQASTTQPKSAVRVEVVYALPDRYWSALVELPVGSNVAQALAAANLEEKVPGLEIDSDMLAIFSRPATLTTALHDGDRIELLRPLPLDPKQLRRERAEKPK